jgi:Ser/Thr protein kinase RdoA (MazF antagonist)
VEFHGLTLRCSLQRWIEGHHVDHLSEDQAHAVGALMGRWHTFAGHHKVASGDAVRYDSHHLERCLAALGVLVGDGSIGRDSWRTIEQAIGVPANLAEELSSAPEAFGVIHGDVIPDNILVTEDGTVRFIDLAQLAEAPYLWDLGVSLYHYSYQAPSVRRAMVAGYRGSRPATVIPRLALEAFICSAALDNLAFQCSIPQQRTSHLFHTNVQRFATRYCRDLLAGVPFALA